MRANTTQVTKIHRLRYRSVPQKGLRLRSILWLIIGLSGVTTLASVWIIVLMNGTAPSHDSFVGQLSPDADPIVVTLPKGAILREIHTPRNSEVRQGQTVATLDTDAMKRRLESLTAELLHDDMLRECLLLEEIPDMAHFSELSELALDHARLARQDCEAFLGEKQAISDRQKNDLALKSDERGLIDRYIAILTTRLKSDLPPQEREADSRQALALALLRNKLQREIANSGFDADKQGAEWQKRRLDRIRLLGNAIRAKTELRSHILRLLDRPRLQAPENGFVVQVRSVPRDQAMHEDVDLVVMRPEDGIGYSASFEVPHSKLDHVGVGQAVKMTMLGMLDDGLVLTGTIRALNTTGRPSVRAEVQLDADSITLLDNPDIGIALRGLGTASVVRVQKNDLDAVSVVRDTLRMVLFSEGRPWFYRRFVVAPNSTERPVMAPG